DHLLIWKFRTNTDDPLGYYGNKYNPWDNWNYGKMYQISLPHQISDRYLSVQCGLAVRFGDTDFLKFVIRENKFDDFFIDYSWVIANDFDRIFQLIKSYMTPKKIQACTDDLIKSLANYEYKILLNNVDLIKNAYNQDVLWCIENLCTQPRNF